MQLKDGYLIVLPRDEAKAFFGHREDQARLDYVREMLTHETTKKLCLDGNWQSLHEALATVEIEDSVLGQCILGGRPMHQGDDYVVCLVRPDVVGFITQQGAVFDHSHIPAELVEQFEALLALYQAAGEIGGAMVFAAQK